MSLVDEWRRLVSDTSLCARGLIVFFRAGKLAEIPAIALLVATYACTYWLYTNIATRVTRMRVVIVYRGGEDITPILEVAEKYGYRVVVRESSEFRAVGSSWYADDVNTVTAMMMRYVKKKRG